MGFAVIISPEAESDLDSILAYVAENDGDQRASQLVVALEETCAKLADLPRRGTVIAELRSISAEYRQIHYKPYRIISGPPASTMPSRTATTRTSGFSSHSMCAWQRACWTGQKARLSRSISR